MVSHKLWAKVVELIKFYGVKMSCVTNGYFIKQRFTEDLTPSIDEICVSMDGNSQEVHSFNRGGSSIKKAAWIEVAFLECELNSLF